MKTKLSAIIVTAFCSFLFGCAHTTHEHTSSVLQIRRVVDTSSGDSQPMSIVSKETKEVVNVHRTVLLDETALKSVGVRTDNLGHSTIEITFSAEGRKRFAEITRENVGQRLTIVIEGQLYCAPTIKTEISGGRAEISGNFSKDEANVLAGIERIKKQ